LAVPALLVALLAGCSSTPEAAPPGTVTVGTVTHTLPPTETFTRTITAPRASPGPGGSEEPGLTGDPGRSAAASSAVSSSPATAKPATAKSAPAKSAGTESGPTGAAAAPPAFPTATPTAGDCPYLQSADVSRLAGQRVGRVMLIAAQPQPICVFYRIVDGGWLGAVRVLDTDPARAVAAVDQAVPPADSSPADRPQGWAGGYMLLPDGSARFPDARAVYGVSAGNRAVIAWNSRDQTVKSRQLVEATITSLRW
jgi:hypothetical protein